jgi:hypothetical protein
LAVTANHFFIVGAQRSGTTYLYHVLDQHPEIEMAEPVRPEPKFFMRDDDFAKGIHHYEQHYFSGKSGAWLKGEKSTSYLESPLAAERIAVAYPDAKILVLLRDPVARAVSHWRFSVENEVETLPMAEAFAAEEERAKHFDRERFSVSPFAYLRRGRYMEDIAIWERHFPKEQIRVLVHEGFVGSRDAVAELYRFLAVADDFVPQGLDRRVNTSKAPAKGGKDITDQQSRELAAGFAESNNRLAAAYGLDLGPWRH